MRAMTLHERGLPIGVAKKDEVFAHDLNRHRIRAELFGERRGLLIPAHQIAGRSAGAGLGDEPVLFFRQHPILCRFHRICPIRNRVEVDNSLNDLTAS
jgi:hypothetical protein